MKKLILALSLLLVSCQPQTDTDMQIRPEISLSQDGKTFQGVEGSYCYGMMCVDKIEPKALVKGMEFQEISSDEFTVNTGLESERIEASLMDEKGELLKCFTSAEKLSPTEYNLTACADGKFILEISGYYEKGDMSYLFPLEKVD